MIKGKLENHFIVGNEEDYIKETRINRENLEQISSSFSKELKDVISKNDFVKIIKSNTFETQKILKNIKTISSEILENIKSIKNTIKETSNIINRAFSKVSFSKKTDVLVQSILNNLANNINLLLKKTISNVDIYFKSIAKGKIFEYTPYALEIAKKPYKYDFLEKEIAEEKEENKKTKLKETKYSLTAQKNIIPSENILSPFLTSLDYNNNLLEENLLYLKDTFKEIYEQQKKASERFIEAFFSLPESFSEYFTTILHETFVDKPFTYLLFKSLKNILYNPISWGVKFLGAIIGKNETFNEILDLFLRPIKTTISLSPTAKWEDEVKGSGISLFNIVNYLAAIHKNVWLLNHYTIPKYSGLPEKVMRKEDLYEKSYLYRILEGTPTISGTLKTPFLVLAKLFKDGMTQSLFDFGNYISFAFKNILAKNIFTEPIEFLSNALRGFFDQLALRKEISEEVELHEEKTIKKYIRKLFINYIKTDFFLKIPLFLNNALGIGFQIYNSLEFLISIVNPLSKGIIDSFNKTKTSLFVIGTEIQKTKYIVDNIEILTHRIKEISFDILESLKNKTNDFLLKINAEIKTIPQKIIKILSTIDISISNIYKSLQQNFPKLIKQNITQQKIPQLTAKDIHIELDTTNDILTTISTTTLDFKTTVEKEHLDLYSLILEIKDILQNCCQQQTFPPGSSISGTGSGGTPTSSFLGIFQNPADFFQKLESIINSASIDIVQSVNSQTNVHLTLGNKILEKLDDIFKASKKSIKLFSGIKDDIQGPISVFTPLNTADFQKLKASARYVPGKENISMYINLLKYVGVPLTVYAILRLLFGTKPFGLLGNFLKGSIETGIQTYKDVTEKGWSYLFLTPASSLISGTYSTIKNELKETGEEAARRAKAGLKPDTFRPSNITRNVANIIESAPGSFNFFKNLYTFLSSASPTPLPKPSLSLPQPTQTPGFFSRIFASISNFFTTQGKFSPGTENFLIKAVHAINKTINSVSTLFSNIKNTIGTFFTTGPQHSGFMNWFINATTTAKNYISSGFTKVVSFFSSYSSGIKNVIEVVKKVPSLPGISSIFNAASFVIKKTFNIFTSWYTQMYFAVQDAWEQINRLWHKFDIMEISRAMTMAAGTAIGTIFGGIKGGAIGMQLSKFAHETTERVAEALPVGAWVLEKTIYRRKKETYEINEDTLKTALNFFYPNFSYLYKTDKLTEKEKKQIILFYQYTLQNPGNFEKAKEKVHNILISAEKRTTLKEKYEETKAFLKILQKTDEKNIAQENFFKTDDILLKNLIEQTEKEKYNFKEYKQALIHFNITNYSDALKLDHEKRKEIIKYYDISLKFPILYKRLQELSRKLIADEISKEKNKEESSLLSKIKNSEIVNKTIERTKALASTTKNITEEKLKIVFKNTSENLENLKLGSNSIAEFIKKKTPSITSFNLSSFNTLFTSSSIAETIARRAEEVASSMNTKGFCARGVNTTLSSLNLETRRGHAFEVADKLANNRNFREITALFPTPQSLLNAPRGAIIIFDRNPNPALREVYGGGWKYGHIAVYLGNGKEASDHIQNLQTSINNIGKKYGPIYRVFIPVEKEENKKGITASLTSIKNEVLKSSTEVGQSIYSKILETPSTISNYFSTLDTNKYTKNLSQYITWSNIVSQTAAAKDFLTSIGSSSLEKAKTYLPKDISFDLEKAKTYLSRDIPFDLEKAKEHTKSFLESTYRNLNINTENVLNKATSYIKDIQWQKTQDPTLDRDLDKEQKHQEILEIGTSIASMLKKITNVVENFSKEDLMNIFKNLTTNKSNTNLNNNTQNTIILNNRGGNTTSILNMQTRSNNTNSNFFNSALE